MSELPDYVAAVIDLLASDADVRAMVGRHFYGGELPPSISVSMPQSALVVKRAGSPGGYGNAWQNYGDIRIDIFAYGVTPALADRLYRRLNPVLQKLVRRVHRRCLLHWAREGGGPIPVRDPDGDWPTVVSSWQLLVARVSTP